jgi:hypothetical protein
MGLVLVFVPLFPVHAQVASITLDWTAPGDDGVIGTASSYQVRWSATKPDTTTTAAMNAWWSAAASVATLPAPAIAGTAQSVAVPGPFTTGQTYYFVILACDEVPNCATYSNVASKFLPDTVPPSRIVDLRTR